MIPFLPTPEELPRLLDGSQPLIVRAVEPQPIQNGIAYDAELGDIVCHDYYLAPSDYIWEGEPQYNWASMCPLGAPGGVVFVAHDVGECPRCHGRLYAEISADGSAWECDRCIGCDSNWWHSPPKAPPHDALHIRIKSVGCRRVQTVTEKRAAAGVKTFLRIGEDVPYRNAFIREWNINNPAHPWPENPWAWFCQVERCERP